MCNSADWRGRARKQGRVGSHPLLDLYPRWLTVYPVHFSSFCQILSFYAPILLTLMFLCPVMTFFLTYVLPGIVAFASSWSIIFISTVRRHSFSNFVMLPLLRFKTRKLTNPCYVVNFVFTSSFSY